MSDDPLDFAIDLESVRDRLSSLSYFTSVTNLQAATVAIENMNAIPPAAFVAIASETAEKNKLIGDDRQRVTVSLSILFCVPAESASDTSGDELEEARKAVMRILFGWTPVGALASLEFDRYLLRASGDGLIWGEVLMRTTYRFSLFEPPAVSPFAALALHADFAGGEFWQDGVRLASMDALPGSNFQRSGPATMFDAAGKLVFAPHNLLTFSAGDDGRVGVVGLGGVLPTGWSTVANAGMVVQVVATNIHPVLGGCRIRISGTPDSLFRLQVSGLATMTLNAPATLSANVRLAAGSTPAGSTFNLVNGASIPPAIPELTVPLESARLSASGLMTGGTGARAEVRIPSTAGPVDVTLDIAALQIEQGSVARPYLATTSAPVYRARVTTDPVTLTALGLLAEDPRTNLLTQSEGDVTTYPTKGLVTDAAATIPGFLNAVQFAPNASVAYAYKPGGTIAVGTVVTFSFFVEMGDDDGPPVILQSSVSGDLSIIIEGGTGSAATLLIAPLGGRLYRASVVRTTTGAGAGNFGVAKYAAQSGRSFKVSGYQLEVGSFPTSYIPTVAGTVTRSTDYPILPSPITTDEDFVVLAEARFDGPSGTGNQIIFQFDNGSTGNRFLIYRNSAGLLAAMIAAAGVSLGKNDPPGSGAIVTGRTVVALRRRAGAWNWGYKKPDGTVAFGAGGAISGFPSGIGRIGFGNSSSEQLGHPLAKLQVRKGFISDADVIAMLTAA